MRRILAFLIALPSVALAGPAPVIGGSDAPAGKWPDVAAVNDSRGDQACTGTLIAPTVVLTAQHCMDIDPGSVLVGTSSLDRLQEGEVIEVTKAVGYPNGFRTFDVGVLVLANASRFEPRAIATGWATLEIKNGAMAPIVGYGAVDRNSSMYINELQEAVVPITDADCTTSAGCNAQARPAGELGAGGMGVDTCQGDSGGPIYVTTSYGTFLAGVTSRGYDSNRYTCSEGGIYVRPDKVIQWIEETAGVPVTRGPEPEFEALVATQGGAAETTIIANDPLSDSHTFTISKAPATSTAAIRDDGRLRVCTSATTPGSDSLDVTITDTKDTSRALTVTIPITVNAGEPETCNVEEFDEDGGCCSTSRGSLGGLPLALAVGLLLRRRRR